MRNNINDINTKMPRIALIPAFQPDEKMMALLCELRENDFKIVVVNDGSGEEYSKLFSEAEMYSAVLTHKENKGKGAAIKTGLEYISNVYEAPYTVVTVDADGQHKVKDAIHLCEESSKSPKELLLGSRKFSGKVPLRSFLGNTITRFVFRISSGVKIYDTQTGLRAFSNELVEPLKKIPGERYEYEMNVLMTFAKEGIPIREEWIETVYIDDNSSSHFDTIKDSYRIYKEIILFSGSSLASFFIDYLLYCIFLLMSGSIVFSNVLARIISGSFNYTLNRRMVFRSSSPIAKSAFQYALLAIIILCVNTIILKALATTGISAYLAKIMVEIIMFIFSWAIQHIFIFKN